MDAESYTGAQATNMSHMGMQRSLCSLLVALCIICVVAGSVRGQSERILLVGGNYRLQTNAHTMQPRGGFFGAPTFEDGPDDPQFFFDTRLRLFLDIHPHPLILVNYKMEIGDITFGVDDPPLVDSDGRRLENVGQGTGGRPGSDGVNIETKNFYLDVQVPWLSGLSFRGGIIGWGDQFDWTILATDFTGAQLTYQRQAFWSQFTFLKFAEGGLRTNDDDSNWFALDTRVGLWARTAITSSLYIWDDNDNDNPVTGRDAYQLYAGIKFNTVLFGKGLLELSGVYNRGQEFLGQAQTESFDGTVVRLGLTNSDNQGVMANLHFDYPIAKHWLGLTLQYISGENGSRSVLDGRGEDVDAFLGLFNSQYTGFGLFRYTEGGGLELLSLGQMNDSTSGLNNVNVSPFFGGGYNGRLLAVLRSKLYATPVLFFYIASGLDWAARGNANGDTFRGFELSTYMHWDIIPKLWLRAGAAFMLTGSWWENNVDLPLQGFPEPLGLESGDRAHNIFQFTLRLQYDFG
ncbi:hypothetical protein NKDENANG_02873 [Candidatus Entotheonellaceae bacterium PAL068K]